MLRKICNACEGTGFLNDDICPICNGFGNIIDKTAQYKSLFKDFKGMTKSVIMQKDLKCKILKSLSEIEKVFETINKNKIRIFFSDLVGDNKDECKK